MFTSNGLRCYAITLLLTTISCTSRIANEILVPRKSCSNGTIEGTRRLLLVQRAIPQQHRLKREGAIGLHMLTAQEKQDVVDKHNEYRRGEGSSNMNKLTWSAQLAQLAGDLARMCIFRHGFPTLDPDQTPIQPGQNILAHGVDVGLPSTINSYMAEKADYDYDKGCNLDKDCGHYTQVVWALTKEVGCAYAKCDDLPGFSQNSFFYVCNYLPAMEGFIMYLKGPACSQCTENQWCEDGLCVGSCKEADAGKHCDCQAACQNCGNVQTDSCTCKCADGFMGPDCSAKCVEKLDCPKMDANQCSSNEFLSRECPVLCGICKASSPGGEVKTCGVDRVHSTAAHLKTSAMLIQILSLLCLQNNRFMITL